MSIDTISLPLSDIHSYRRNNPPMAKHTENKENKVGPIIERRLRELGRSQQWLAEQCNVSPVSVNNWIHKGSIARQNIGPAAIALGLTTAQLMGDDQPAQQSVDMPPKMSLQWLPPDEVELLEEYRQCAEEGKKMTLSFVKVAPKKNDGDPYAGQRHAA